MQAPTDAVIEALQGCNPSPQAPLVVAFSGGLDSTVLLHAAVQAWGPACVVAAHVDHQLQAGASDWLAHCRNEAQALGVRFEGCSLVPRAKGNLEAWARQARYEALTQMARNCAACALATAHHADDQLETLLMALARGAGLDGLTGIAEQTPRGGVALIRPLLALPRAVLAAWAEQHRLRWIEDPMNAWPQLRRTAIRAQLTPVLDAVLPGLRQQLPQALASLRESREALDEAARLDLAALEVSPRALHALDRDALAAWPEPRQRRVLRGWLASLGLAMPTRARLQAIRSQCLEAASAHAHLRHEGWHLVRQGPRLLAWPDAAQPRWQAPIEPQALSGWGDQGLALPDGTWLRRSGEEPIGDAMGTMDPRTDGPGNPWGWLSQASFGVLRPTASLRVRLREARPSREVRKLWQEAGVPVSVRPACGLILANGSPFWLVPFGLLAGPWPCGLAESSRVGAKSGLGGSDGVGGLALHWDAPAGDPRRLP